MEAFVDLALKKIDNLWTSNKIVNDLSAEFLENATESFQEIPDDSKCRLLISLTLVKKRKGSEEGFKSAVHKLITLAKKSSVEWVKVTGELVSQRLPYFLEMPSGTECSELKNSIDEIKKSLKLINPSLVPPPLSFLPLHLQYSSSEFIPKEYDISLVSKNFHFQPKEEEEIIISKETSKPNLNLNSTQIEQQKAKQVQLNQNKLKRKLNEEDIQKRLEKLTKNRNDKPKQPTIKFIDSPQDILPISNGNGVSKAQKAVLMEILTNSSKSNKLSVEGRKTVEEYLREESKGKNKVETIVIAEITHKIDETHFKIEQTKLRIDFKNRQIKKVKAIKRFRVTPKTE